MLDGLPEIDFTLEKIIECANGSNSFIDIESYMNIYGVFDKETFSDLVIYYKGSLKDA